MLCFDLMETIGAKVEEKREQDALNDLNHFSNSSNSRHLVQTLKEMRRDLEGIQEEVPDMTMLEMMAQLLHYSGDNWEENHEDSDWFWYDQPELWEVADPYVTKAFLEGSEWEKLGVE